MKRAEQVIGIPPEVTRDIDRDRAAYLHGPAALDTRLHTATRAQLEARYRALLTEAAYASTRAARMAWEDLETEAAREEQNDTRRGGGA